MLTITLDPDVFAIGSKIIVEVLDADFAIRKDEDASAVEIVVGVVLANTLATFRISGEPEFAIRNISEPKVFVH